MKSKFTPYAIVVILFTIVTIVLLKNNDNENDQGSHAKVLHDSGTKSVSSITSRTQSLGHSQTNIKDRTKNEHQGTFESSQHVNSVKLDEARTLEEVQPGHSYVINNQLLTDIDSLNDAFVDGENQVYRNAIVEVFSAESFTDVISGLRSVEESEKSIERELQLSSSLSQFRSRSMYDEDFTCRGRICAITFKQDNNDNFDLDRLSKFDSNFVFKNFVDNESGDTQVNAVFIQTDDPSRLQLNTD